MNGATSSRSPGPERDFFRMSWLLPRVEKQIADLDAADREKLFAALLAPVAASRCEPVENRQRRGIFKFKVGRDLRVCFRMEGRFGVVVFIGDHFQCGRFLDRHAGSVYGRLIPIEDFAMRMKEAVEANKSVVSPQEPAPAPAIGPAEKPPEAVDDRPADTSPTFPEWMKMLPRVIDTTFGTKVREAEDACLALMAGVTSRVDTLQAGTTGLALSIEVLGQRFGVGMENLSRDITVLTSLAHATEQKVETVSQQLHSSSLTLRTDLEAFADLSERQMTLNGERFEVVESQVSVLDAKCSGVGQSVKDLKNVFDDSERTFSASLIEMRDQLAVLDARDPVAPLLPVLTEHRERIEAQDRAANSARAEIAQCDERIATLFAEVGQIKEVACSLTRATSNLAVTINSLSAKVEALATRELQREERTLGARLARMLSRVRERLQTGRNEALGRSSFRAPQSGSFRGTEKKVAAVVKKP